MSFPRYDRLQSYQWNYDNPPEVAEVEIPKWPGDSSFCGYRLKSPLGMPAGPLLNGQWCLYYASLGFDFVTYKTVRSGYRACYELPNLQPVRVGMLQGGESDVPTQNEMTGSWAVSYGMPSTEPEIWQKDVMQTRDQLPADKILCVSVVGSVQPDWTLQQLADDYALCARMAIESGADFVEANFSCPNVSTCDGQLYQIPEDCRLVVETIRTQISNSPLIGKIGRIADSDQMRSLLAAIHPFVDALAMTNSIATRVKNEDGEFLFDGQQRGICGKATLNASVEQTRLAKQIIRDEGYELQLIGVGGASCLEDVEQYLDAGATAVHIATAAMENPEVAMEIKAAASVG
ncbi:MAG: hypothetical protein CMJ79_14170 [Planctomycetaceae bacterium]|nr:hypothetical protein [Planctomycetaceae bacterium]|tara:strand:- start:13280 stop:14320 length:1041 start_codon:yes stop_codon:yes gene_type:complete